MKMHKVLLFAILSVACMSCNEPEKNVYTFETQSIGLEGVANARELGGYVLPDGKMIKHGLLLRGGMLGNMTESDSIKLHDVFHLAHVFDFRLGSEAELNPDKLVDGCRYSWFSIMSDTSLVIRMVPKEYMLNNTVYYKEHAHEPLMQKAAVDMYPSVFENPYSQQMYAAFFREVLDTQEGAIYFHCSHGKDRTGMGSALMLAALGADKELIINDFGISNEFFQPRVDKINAELKAKGYGEKEFATIQSFIGVNLDNLKRALERLENQYGSLVGYLHSKIGLSDEDIAILRQRYLE